MNITVYLGALEGNDPALGDAVRELGTWIGESGNSLVYGGSKSGLMGHYLQCLNHMCLTIWCICRVKSCKHHFISIIEKCHKTDRHKRYG